MIENLLWHKFSNSKPGQGEKPNYSKLWRILTIWKVFHEDTCTRNGEPPAINIPCGKDTSAYKMTEDKNNQGDNEL